MRTSLFTFLSLLFSFSSLFAQPETVVQFGHVGGSISKIILSSDEKFMATTDGQILKLWDLESGLEYRTIGGGELSFNGYSSLAFTDNDHVIFTKDQEVQVKNFITNKDAKSWSLNKEEGGSDGEEKEPTKKDLEDLQNQEGYFGFAYSPDRTLLALGSDKKIEILNTSTSQTIQSLKIKQGERNLLELISGRIVNLEIASGNDLILVDTAVYQFTSRKPKYIFNQKIEKFEIIKSTFSKDGKRLYLAGNMLKEINNQQEFSLSDITNGLTKKYLKNIDHGLILILDAQSGEEVSQHKTAPIFGMQQNNAGNQLAIIHDKNQIQLYTPQMTKQSLIQCQEGQLLIELGFIQYLPSLHFSNNDKSLFVGGASNHPDAVTQYNTTTGNKMRALGAAIPPIVLHPQPTKSDSIILKEVELEMGSIFTPMKEIEKGFRMLNLKTAKAPTAFARFDKVIFSPRKDMYLFQEKDKAVQLYTTEFDEYVVDLEMSSDSFSVLKFSENNNYIGGVIGTKALVWDTKTGKLIHEKISHEKTIQDVVFTADEQFICTTSKDESVKFWSTETGEMTFEKEPLFKTGNLVSVGKTINEVRKALGGLGNVRKPRLRDLAKKKDTDDALVSKGGPDHIDIMLNLVGFNNYYDAQYSPDGKLVALWGKDYATVHFYDIEKNKVITKVKSPGILLMRQIFAFTDPAAFETIKENEESDSTVVGGESEVMMAQMMEMMLDGYNLKNQSAINEDWTLFARAIKPMRRKKKTGIYVDEIGKKRFNRKKKNKLKESEDYSEGLVFSSNGRMIAASSPEDNNIRIWDVDSKKVLKTLEGHSGEITFGPSDKVLISKGWDKQIKIWDLETEKALYSFIGIKGENDYVVMLPEGYYTASRKNTRAIAFRQGRRVYPFEQFDAQFNRPDKILKTLNETSAIHSGGKISDNALIKRYEKAYQKRLELLGISETVFENDFEVPEIKMKELPTTTSNKDLKINFSATDKRHPLANVNIFVNGVPVYGRNGKQLSSTSQKSFTGDVTVKLNQGKNTIQAKVINANGVESLYDFAEVQLKGSTTTPKLHLVLLGSNKFEDAEVTPLKYPTIDLQKIQGLFEKGNATFPNRQVLKYSYQNEQFTKANFDQLKNKLANISVDDQVLIFFSTHGFIDEASEYHLVTYSTAQKSPEGQSITMENLNDLLDQIPARQKAVFIDACFSGEIDEQAIMELKKKNTKEGKVNFRSVGNMTWGQQNGLANMEQMKDLFVGLRKSTGATVIASAGSGEYAMEGDQWNNSVFAFAFLNGIQNKNADLNHDGKITISELQMYLPRKVSNLTNGEQIPTFQYENIMNDFVIW